MTGDSQRGAQEKIEGEQYLNIASLIGRVMIIPLAAFVYSMEMLIKNMQQMQRVTSDGMRMMAGENLLEGVDAHRTTGSTMSVMNEAVTGCNVDNAKEQKRMTNGYSADQTNLSGEELKLVRYTPNFRKRNFEYAWPSDQELVTNDRSESDLEAQRLGNFMSKLDKTARPEIWVKRNYPPTEKGTNINTIPDEDKKFMYVLVEVLQRFPRDKGQYQDDQLKYLAGIKDAIENAGNKIA